MPLRSTDVPANGPSGYPRGVCWSDVDFPDTRTILIHDSRGKLLVECRIAAECADEDAERGAWAWLNKKDPEIAPPASERQPLRLA